MRLIADVLDEQLHDVNRQNAGRIDGIILELRENAPPRLTYVEVGPITLLARFSKRLARWYSRFDRRLGPGRGTSFRIPWNRLTREHPAFKMDLDVESTSINALEDWLRERIVGHIPGS